MSYYIKKFNNIVNKNKYIYTPSFEYTYLVDHQIPNKSINDILGKDIKNKDFIEEYSYEEDLRIERICIQLENN